MEGMIMTAQLLPSLSILIVVHEGGHFFAARLFNIKVEKFYLSSLIFYSRWPMFSTSHW